MRSLIELDTEIRNLRAVCEAVFADPTDMAAHRKLEAMLGSSLDTPYFASSGRDLIYLLGRERDSMFLVDSEWLLNWLDSSGRFERYQVWTD